MAEPNVIGGENSLPLADLRPISMPRKWEAPLIWGVSCVNFLLFQAIFSNCNPVFGQSR